MLHLVYMNTQSVNRMVSSQPPAVVHTSTTVNSVIYLTPLGGSFIKHQAKHMWGRQTGPPAKRAIYFSNSDSVFLHPSHQQAVPLLA